MSRLTHLSLHTLRVGRGTRQGTGVPDRGYQTGGTRHGVLDRGTRQWVPDRGNDKEVVGSFISQFNSVDREPP